MKFGGTVSIILLSLVFLVAPQLVTAESSAEEANSSVALHMLAGASGALFVSAIAYPLVYLDNHSHSALLVAGLGVGGALVLGAAKELLDLSGWGDPQWSDLLLTVAGGLLASSLVYALTCLQSTEEVGILGLSAMYGAFAVVLSMPVGENLYRRFILSSRSRL